MVRDATLDMCLAPRAPQGEEDPAIRFKPIAQLNQIVVARCGHPLAHRLRTPRSAAELAGPDWLSNLQHLAAAETLRAVGVPEPRQIMECESFSAMRSLLVKSDMLALVQHPFLGMPHVADDIQEIPIAERLPGKTVGLHTRADAPLTRPAAALARLLVDVGRKLLQRPLAP